MKDFLVCYVKYLKFAAHCFDPYWLNKLIKGDIDFDVKRQLPIWTDTNEPITARR